MRLHGTHTIRLLVCHGHRATLAPEPVVSQVALVLSAPPTASRTTMRDLSQGLRPTHADLSGPHRRASDRGPNLLAHSLAQSSFVHQAIVPQGSRRKAGRSRHNDTERPRIPVRPLTAAMCCAAGTCSCIDGLV